jgi:hypothetical protein
LGFALQWSCWALGGGLRVFFWSGRFGSVWFGALAGHGVETYMHDRELVVVVVVVVLRSAWVGCG